MNSVPCHASVTQDPWVFYGTQDANAQDLWNPRGGNWVIADGNTGAIVAQYALSARVNSTAIAHGSDDGSGYGNDWMVVTTRWSKNGTGSAGGGVVFAFRDKGPRPRLYVPQTFVQLPPLQGSDLPLAQRTDEDAVMNTGCTNLTFSAALYTPALMAAKLSTVSAAGQEQAGKLANKFVEHTVDELLAVSQTKKSEFFEKALALDDEAYLPAEQVKPAIANSASLAVPDWVTIVSPLPFPATVAGGGSVDFTFEFTRSKIPFLSISTFYLNITSSNDPDYCIEDPAKTPIAQIKYSVPYVFCLTVIDEMFFGDEGVAWTNNLALLGNSEVFDEFAPTGSGDHLFSGSMYFMNDMNSAAWNPISGSGGWDPLIDGGFLSPFFVSGEDNCGSCVKNGNLPVAGTTNGFNYSWVVGDICSWAVIDTGQEAGFTAYGGNNPGDHQGGPSMGLLVKYREVGAYGPDYGAFKLTVMDIINRNATAIDGLYYGSFIDWDVQNDNRDTGTADPVKGYVYQYGSNRAYGTIGLPSKGNYWPDLTKTDPMYNVRIMAASDYQEDLQFDSLYDWANKYAEHSVTNKPTDVPVNPATDRSTMATYGKIDLGANGTPAGQHTFGFATFGIEAFTGPTDVDNLRKFVNKFAGFGRGDVNNDDVINLLDLVRMSKAYPAVGPPLTLGPGPVPFRHLGDVDNDGDVDHADVVYLAAYFFTGGPPPKSTFLF